MPLKYQGGENIMIELFKLAQHDLLLKKQWLSLKKMLKTRLLSALLSEK